MAGANTHLTQEEQMALLLATVSKIEAKVDFIMGAHIKERANQSGLTEEQQTVAVEEAVNQQAQAALSTRLDALRNNRKPYTGF